MALRLPGLDPWHLFSPKNQREQGMKQKTGNSESAKWFGHQRPPKSMPAKHREKRCCNISLGGLGQARHMALYIMTEYTGTDVFRSKVKQTRGHGEVLPRASSACSFPHNLSRGQAWPDLVCFLGWEPLVSRVGSARLRHVSCSLTLSWRTVLKPCDH